MEDARWLKLVTIGLVLAAMAFGYFLLAQRFAGPKVSDSKKQEVAVSQPSPRPTTTPSAESSGVRQTPASSAAMQTPKSAYQRVAERTKGEATQLPATGFPAVLVGILAASAAIVGFGLRKFPH